MSVNTKNWQELEKPNSLDVREGGDRKRKATFVAEPLERGYGLMLGPDFRLPAVRVGKRRGGRCARDRRSDRPPPPASRAPPP
jgi:hypothetical protein